jgi:hypothetical protein
VAKRIRRNPGQLIEDLQQKIAELEQKKQAHAYGRDPVVKIMRLVRMYLRKALDLAKPDGPLPPVLLRQGQAFLADLDEGLVALGARKPRPRRKRRGD